jgi:hypothetical protein
MSPNKQLQRTVTRRHGRGACASLHCAHAPRWTRGRAAAELRRYAARFKRCAAAVNMVSFGVNMTRIMKATVSAMLSASLPLVVLAQVAPSPCDGIKQREAQIAESREQISKLRVRYTEKHPEVLAARRKLERLETSLEQQVLLAKSQGIACPTGEPERK